MAPPNSPPSSPPTASRRGLLAAGTAALAASAGCIARGRQVFSSTTTEQVSLEIKTLPADSDPYAIQIARRLHTNLQLVGIDTTLTVLSRREFRRQVLLNADFDIFVGRVPHTLRPDPDVLYPLFESSFAASSGWQNPYGLLNFQCDRLLADQRTTADADRTAVVHALQEQLADIQVVTPVAYPNATAGYRTNRITGWADSHPTRPHNLLGLTPPDDEDQELRLSVVNSRITSNRNPISTALREDGSLTELLYDSLAVRTTETGDDTVETTPWLARDISWHNEDSDDEPLSATVTLRDRVQWHQVIDDRPFVTAADVRFTYNFLADTSLGRAATPIPSPRFDAHASLVDSVSVAGPHELTITFVETTRTVAERALTVPILPAHIWGAEDRTEVDSSWRTTTATTAALSWNNPSPVGSGPIQFVDADGGDSVTFSRFESHFLWRDPDDVPATPAGADTSTDGAAGNETTADSTNETAGSTNETSAWTDETETDETEQATGDDETDDETGDNEAFEDDETTSDDEPAADDETAPQTQTVEPLDLADLPEGFDDEIPFEQLTVEATSSDNTAVELLLNGSVDAVDTVLRPTTIERITEDEAVELDTTSQPASCYHVGYNTRRLPLRNPHFRRAVARLVDTATIVSEDFNDYADPATNVLARPGAETAADWIPQSLRWDGADPKVPFIGTEGELDGNEARSLFRSVGYQYDSDQRLVSTPD